MKKLKLQMDQLAVESFPTGTPDALPGTVEARELGPSTTIFCGPTPGTKLTCCPCTPAY